MLTDERFADLFTADEQAARAHVPWTRLVAEGATTRDGKDIDLVPHIRANRHDLVLKPNDEYGGVGVTLGWEADEAAWDTTLDRALGGALGAWVVQERIHVRRELFPKFAAGHGAVIGDMLVDCAPVSLPRQAGRLPDAPQRDRPRQRHVRRRPGPVLCRQPARMTMQSS